MLKILLPLFSILILSLSNVSACSNEKSHDHPSVHGMLMVGSSKIYLSHLPMFHTPHDYQVIIEVELQKDAQAAYVNSLQSNPETIYTLVPETFVLPDMINSPRPFLAQIYKGHFERGGELIAENVEVKITKILYFKKFNSAETKPILGNYILFGNANEKFLAHKIFARPDFDQIVKVEANVDLKDSSISIFSKSLLNSEALTVNSNIDSDIKIKMMSTIYLETSDLSF